MRTWLMLFAVFFVNQTSADGLDLRIDSSNLRKSGAIASDRPLVTLSVWDDVINENLYLGGFISTSRGVPSESGLYFGYSQQFSSLKIDSGVSYYNLHSLQSWWGIGNEVVIHTDLQYSPFRENNPVQGFMRLEHKLVSGFSNGFYSYAGVRFNIPVFHNVNIKGETALLHNLGVYTPGSITSAYADTSLEWKLNASTTLEAPRVLVTWPVSATDDVSHFSLGIGLKFAF